jgi:TRAP-type C4-dicarboxylate transport system permease small subunit
MERVFVYLARFSRTLNWVAGALLVIMMLLTVADVALRYFGRGIVGAYELTSFAGALVVGFAIAKTSIDKAHVSVDILVEVVGKRWKTVMLICAKLIGFLIFVLLGWALFCKGNEIYDTGEVSMTLHLPFYPVAYGLSLCSLLESLVLLSDMAKGMMEWNHE